MKNLGESISDNLFEGSTILITGGTGSFGKMFIKMTLEKYNPKKIIIFSRDEMKQWDMQQEFSDPRLRFFIGNVRDSDRLHRALDNVDYIVHAAATKIVPTAEYNPFECIKTNVNGAMNVIDCSINQKVKKVVALSTDKASNPVNLYGASKLCSDKLFVAGNAYSGEHKTTFSVVRYGNVIGSRGSVIPFFKKLAPSGVLTITDERMTRFMITLPQAVELVWLSFQESHGGEIFVPKIPSMTINQIADAVDDKAQKKIIGIRPGEKLHEQMICPEDATYTFEYENYYKILPNLYQTASDANRIGSGKLCEEGFEYSSINNKEWMPVEELKEIINDPINGLY